MKLVRAALAAVAVGLLAATGMPAGPAGAHATLVETTPAADQLLDRAPATVGLRFDEPVTGLEGAVRIFGPDGDRVDGPTRATGGGTGIDAPVSGPTRGTYTVAWKVVSEDGHTLSGSFVFHVGDRTGAVAIDDGAPVGVAPFAAVGRWLTLAGAIVAGGTAVVALTNAGDRALALRPLMAAAGGVGVVGVVLTTLAQTAVATGRDLLAAVPLMVETATATRPGLLTVARGGLLALVFVAAAMGGPWRRRPMAMSAVVAGSAGATFVASALAGHPWTTDARVVAVAADVAHGLAVAVWAGGLVALARLRRRDRDGGTGVGAVARRFSSVALVAAAVVGVTGTASAWLQLAELEALWATGYGRLVLAKVTGFTLLVALGWLNRARLVATVERSAATLLRSVRAEVVTVALVVAATAVLVDAPPARVTADRPFDDVVVVEDASAQLTVEPARVGANDLHLYFYDRTGTEPLAVDAVAVQAAVADLPPRKLPVEPVAPTHVSVYGASLTSPGRWTVTVTAVRAGRPTVFSFEVPVR